MIKKYWNDFVREYPYASSAPHLALSFEEYCRRRKIKLSKWHNYVGDFVDTVTQTGSTRVNYRRTLRELCAFLCRVKGVEQAEDEINDVYILHRDGSYEKKEDVRNE